MNSAKPSTKPKVEAIYPLTFLQRSLLFHHQAEDNDQGFLHVQCTIKGVLETDLLQQAWRDLSVRHSALRSSVHWDGLPNPVQVVHEKAEISWSLEDWSGLDADEFADHLEEFLRKDRKAGINLAKAPAGRVVFIKKEQDVHLMLWTCHHILLDGWSTGVVLNDLLTYYAGRKGEEVVLPAIPGYGNYLKHKSGSKSDLSRSFWESQFSGLNTGTKLSNNSQGSASWNAAKLTIDKTNTAGFLASASRSRVTSGTLIQAIWGLVLARLLGTEDIVFGTTVSGRNLDLPNIELMCGLFMNVLPARVTINKEEELAAWLARFQSSQAKAQKYSHVTTDEVIEWAGLENIGPLYDTLVIIENFPWEPREAAGIRIQEFSGGITSTYPLNLMVIPGETLHFEIRYDASKVTNGTVKTLKGLLYTAIQAVSDASPGSTVGDIIDQLPKQDLFQAQVPDIKFTQQDNSTKYIAPRNPVELSLTRLWEKVLGTQPIGVTDDFFELGGKSLNAVRLFALIDEELKHNLAPITILKYRTIEQLAGHIASGNSSAWQSLVPFRAHGSRPPLFCIHAGGGHVFFYNALAKRLGPEQPVYSLQPKGLDGEADMHQSVIEMATSYVEEILEAVPNGPYIILSICYGNAVCLEIARQMTAMGLEVPTVIIVDSAPDALEAIPQPTVGRSFDRYYRILKEGDWGALRERIPIVIGGVKQRLEYATSTRQEKNLKRMQQHIKQLNRDYTWEPYEGKVTLIRSTEMAGLSNRNFHVEHWRELAKAGLDVLYVEGNHHELFIEPTVERLSVQVANAISEVNKKST